MIFPLPSYPTCFNKPRVLHGMQPQVSFFLPTCSLLYHGLLLSLLQRPKPAVLHVILPQFPHSGPSPMAATPRLEPGAVHPGRVRVLKPGPTSPKHGPIVYWMFRDQRARDNWALLHAAHLASRSSAPLAVAFNLLHRFLGAHARQIAFMLRSLRLLHPRLQALGIPLFFLRGEAVETIPNLLSELGASVLVTDFSPLRPVRAWKDEICARVGPGVVVHEVDAHNVVPVWAASDKLEYGARTIRPRIHRLLPEYLVEFPELAPPTAKWAGSPPPDIDWDALIADVLK